MRHLGDLGMDAAITRRTVMVQRHLVRDALEQTRNLPCPVRCQKCTTASSFPQTGLQGAASAKTITRGSPPGPVFAWADAASGSRPSANTLPDRGSNTR